MKKEKNEWMTLVEAANYSRLGLKAIRNFIYDGLLPSYKPRKFRLVKRQELDAFLEASKTRVPENNPMEVIPA